MYSKLKRTSATLATLVALACTLGTSEAAACGGLFCSSASPVNQAAERIVFSDNGDGTITAVIEIKYQGPSERFSWVLPVPGVPEIGISSSQVLDRLQSRSNPTYQLINRFDDSCDIVSDDDAAGGFADAGIGDDSAEEPVVSVLASGSLGPFDYQVIMVNPEAENPASAAIEWLEQNNYDVTALGEEILGDYLADGLNLVAFRLSKNASVGSIRPVSLTYKAERAMIPIRPTAVAANPDMGILVWVLGKHRAVPTNYRTLELNEALIDWFNPNSTYNQVVIAAANEAGGQGFVTERAGNATAYRSVAWSGREDDTWQELQRMTSADRRLELLLDSARTFGAADGYADAIGRAVPLRSGVDVDEFLNCVNCYFDDFRDAGSTDAGVFGDSDAGTTGIRFPKVEEDPIGGMVASDFIDALSELVVEPMQQTQELFDEADYATRLYTTMSPDEMDTDPEFDFNPDLADVDNQHVRERVTYCTEEGDGWVIDFDGYELHGTGRTWPVAPGEQPANWRILQLSTSGAGEVIEDNRDDLLEDLPEFEPEDFPDIDDVRRADEGSRGDDSKSPDDDDDDLDEADEDDTELSSNSTSSDGCGCQLVGTSSSVGGSGLAGLGLMGLGLIALRRRRSPEPS